MPSRGEQGELWTYKRVELSYEASVVADVGVWLDGIRLGGDPVAIEIAEDIVRKYVVKKLTKTKK